MLKKFDGSKFVKVTANDKPVVQYFRSLTDKRFVLDIVAPGFTADDVQVQLNSSNTKLRVTLYQNARPPFDADGDVDTFGYNKVKASGVYAPVDFDIDGTIYDTSDIDVINYSGVIRISVMKFEPAEGWMDLFVADAV